MLDERECKKINPLFSFHIMKFAVQDYRKNSNCLTEQEYNKVYRNANEEMLLHQIILSSDEASCVVIPEPVLEKTIENIISEFPDISFFYDTLSANNLKLSQYMQALQNDLRVETVLGMIASTVQSVSRDEIYHYYRKNKGNFNRPEQRKVSIIQIFITDHGHSDRALDKITRIYKRLSLNPGRFSEEARLYSDCESGKNGGLVGVLGRGELCRQLNDALFSLNKNEISEIIMVGNSYHIIKCDAIYPAVKISYNEAIEQIIPVLLKQKQLNACRTWLKELVKRT